MRLTLPNSAHLQNIEGFIRKLSMDKPSRLSVTFHPRYVHVHPAALAMAASMGALASGTGAKVTGRVPNISSLPYLVRMGLFKHLTLNPRRSIEEHEDSGSFIPLVQIRSSSELSDFISKFVPLLHAQRNMSEPIQYVLSEMVRNVLEHARSETGAFVCAQYYRNKQRVSIGIADTGMGVRDSISRSHTANTAGEAIMLALQPGITGATPFKGGNVTNAGAGLFYTKSIAALSRNFFVLYSEDALFKLLRGEYASAPVLHADPANDNHHLTTGLPRWEGTVVGINLSVAPGRQFADLLTAIRQAYSLDVAKERTSYAESIRFAR